MNIAKVAAEYLSVVALASVLIAGRVLAQESTSTSTSTSTTTTTATPTTSQVTAPGNETTAQASNGVESPLKLNAFVVTGDIAPITELTASFDVSTVSHSDIVTTNYAGPAGLLDSVPGFYGESSGGEVNQNLSVDGIHASFFGYIMLQEDGLPLMYNGFFSEFQERPDTTVERVEVVRNGPSGVFSPEAGSAIVNFISRMPTTDEGDVTIGVTSEGNKRIDFFYGGPIAGTGWSGSVGGYYELGQGERPVGYNMTHGGELKASLEKKFQGGDLTITYKYINATTAFYVDTPVAEDENGHLSAIPGFDPRDDTLYSPALENGTLRPPVGQGAAVPLDQSGNLDQTNQLTVKFAKDFGNGWQLTNGFRIAHIYYQDDDNRSNGNADLMPATSWLSSSLPQLATYAAGLAGSPTVTSDALVNVSTGQTVANPGTLNGNGLLLNSSNFMYHSTFDNIIDDLRGTWKTDKNTFAIGLLYMNVAGTNLGEEGNDMLIDVKNHADPMDIVGLNAQGQVVDHLTDNGVLTYDSGAAPFFGNGNEDLESSNYYIDDDFQITKQLHIDGGYRYEQINFQTQAEGWVFGAPLPIAAANPTVIADQTGAVFGNGNYAYGSNNGNDSAWSIGANYALTDNLSVFARTTKDFDTGVQDFNVFGGQNGNPSRSGFTTLRFDQVGVRFETGQFNFSATGFFGENNHVSQAVTFTSGGVETVYIDYQSTGVDFEAVWSPIRAFQLSVSGVVQRSEVTDVPAGVVADGVVNGDQVARLPDEQIRTKATYFFGRGSVYLLATYYGRRYGDLSNDQIFDPYTNYGAGISFNITRMLSVDVVGDNLGNAIGYTEGNPRGGGSFNTAGESFVLARSIWGRNAKVSCTLRF